MKLNPNEQQVLFYLAGEGDFYWGFAAIGECVRLDRKEIRRACRSLSRKGLAEFKSGLWSLDGGPAGSGYRITKDGVNIALASNAERFLDAMAK